MSDTRHTVRDSVVFVYKVLFFFLFVGHHWVIFRMYPRSSVILRVYTNVAVVSRCWVEPSHNVHGYSTTTPRPRLPVNEGSSPIPREKQFRSEWTGPQISDPVPVTLPRLYLFCSLILHRIRINYWVRRDGRTEESTHIDSSPANTFPYLPGTRGWRNKEGTNDDGSRWGRENHSQEQYSKGSFAFSSILSIGVDVRLEL